MIWTKLGTGRGAKHEWHRAFVTKTLSGRGPYTHDARFRDGIRGVSLTHDAYVEGFWVPICRIVRAPSAAIARAPARVPASARAGAPAPAQAQRAEPAREPAPARPKRAAPARERTPAQAQRAEPARGRAPARATRAAPEREPAPERAQSAARGRHAPARVGDSTTQLSPRPVRKVRRKQVIIDSPSSSRSPSP